MSNMGDVRVDIDYLSIGANRQTAVADWSTCGTVAFGADTNIALWKPDDALPRGIFKLLSGHSQPVKAVKFLPCPAKDGVSYLLSGGDDHCLKLWKLGDATGDASCIQTIQSHTAPVNCIGTLPSRQRATSCETIFASGAADATIMTWIFDGGEIKLLQTIRTNPKYFPLTVALSPLDDDGNSFILAAAGTRATIQVFLGLKAVDGNFEFGLQATLSGHESWIRSLDFSFERSSPGSDLILASASQDKYIRLWRIHQGKDLPVQAATASDPTMGAFLPGKSPSNKAHRIKTDTVDYSITFESLLFNHDDWIYSAKWHTSASGKLQLLSTSADNSLAIWEIYPDSGIWVTSARLGEISREKGATTATGSIGGFWTGLWSPSGASLITLGRTGSWRRWNWDASRDQWIQDVAVTGHVKSVTGIAWSRSGEYLLSTSSDQTTRLHAQWREKGTWHEMARPQIHGYDLNCVDTLGPTQFVSGADEKLMRVFNEPKAVARLLSRLAGIGSAAADATCDMPDAANMPVLGLSNKAVDENDTPVGPAVDKALETDGNPADPAASSALETAAHPPLEETLSRYTLWPEAEKLYGHGYEISCLAASHDGRLVASACKASSLNHAVVRLFETERWTEARPPLAAHSLTATRLRFSGDDRLLLSVGRDRQWAVFGRRGAADGGDAPYALLQAMPRGHTRMILDCAWAPAELRGPWVFATAGRDKCVKIWARKEDGPDSRFELAGTLADDHPVTAVDFLPHLGREQNVVLAAGNDAGRIRIFILNGSDAAVVSTLTLQSELCLPKAVLQLSWRPHVQKEEGADTHELAIAGDDSSLRIYRVHGL